MKPILSVFIFVLSATSIASAQYKKDSVQDQLIQLDKKWTHAELTGDKKTAAEFIADDFVGTTQRGQLQNKTQYLASVAPNADMVKSDEFKVTVYGNTAIMTHRGTVEGVRNIQFRSTHVWMKRAGKWQIVAHHGSRIVDEDDDDEITEIIK